MLALAVASAACKDAPERVEPNRKSLAIAGARVEQTDGGAKVRIEVEVARGSGLDAASVRALGLRRVTVLGVNPMADHTRGISAPPLGWDPGTMPAVQTVAGPASPRQVLFDAQVEPGVTYAYAVSYDDAVSPPVVVRVHDPRTWWPTARVQQAVDALRGSCRVETIGHGGHRGLPIVALRMGSASPDAKTLVVVGAIHAGESGPELILSALAALAERAGKDPELGRALERLSVLAIPVVNVDERDRLLAGHPTYLRLSPQGIDLNRNFPAGWEEVSSSYGTSSAEPGSWTYRGAAPLAAVEARALHDALASVPVAALFSYHWLYSLSGAELEQPTASPRFPAELRARQAAIAAAWYRGLGKRPFPAEVKTPVTDASPGGSLVTWIAAARGAPAFEVEGAGDPRLAKLHQAPPDPALLEEYQARHADALESVVRHLAQEP